MLSKALMMSPPAAIQNISITAPKISEALAKFFLFRLAEEPKPHNIFYSTFAPHSVQNLESLCKGAEQAGHSLATDAGAF